MSLRSCSGSGRFFPFQPKRFFHTGISKSKELLYMAALMSARSFSFPMIHSYRFSTLLLMKNIEDSNTRGIGCASVFLSITIIIVR